jgi:hypothetical protein
MGAKQEIVPTGVVPLMATFDRILRTRKFRESEQLRRALERERLEKLARLLPKPVDSTVVHERRLPVGPGEDAFASIERLREAIYTDRPRESVP